MKHHDLNPKYCIRSSEAIMRSASTNQSQTASNNSYTQKPKGYDTWQGVTTKVRERLKRVDLRESRKDFVPEDSRNSHYKDDANVVNSTVRAIPHLGQRKRLPYTTSCIIHIYSSTLVWPLKTRYWKTFVCLSRWRSGRLILRNFFWNFLIHELRDNELNEWDIEIDPRNLCSYDVDR